MGAAKKEQVQKWLADVKENRGLDLESILGCGKSLQLSDFRSPDEVDVKYNVRRTETAGLDLSVKAAELQQKRDEGRKRLQKLSAPRDVSPSPTPKAGATGSDDIVRVCNKIRCMGQDVQETLVACLVRARKDTDMGIKTQSEVLEILGDENFDMVITVLNNRDKVYQDLMSDMEQYSTFQREDRAPAGPTVYITSRTEKKQKKQEAKASRRLDLKEHARQQEYLRSLATKHDRDAKAAEDAAFFDSNRGEDVMDTLKTLSPDTTYTQHRGYLEIMVPMAQRPQVPKEDLYPVSAFPEWAQLAFGGITHLNPVQTKVADCAFNTTENMLICAPTGAGKTICALLTMLQEISRHITPEGTLTKDEFKMVYVCPMKALAQEMVENFRKKLSPYNMVVKECTGDAQLTKREMAECHLLVTTPEKWDVITRKKTEALVGKTNLIIFDEIHLLNEDRGPVIEVLVARMLREQVITQRTIRLVGLSATLPNYRDVSDFLNVARVTGLFVFDGAYRPVPLRQTFIGIQEKAKNTQSAIALRSSHNPGEENDKNKKGPPPSRDQSWLYDKLCFERVINALRNGKQVMIFVHSRAKTYKVACAMRDMAMKEGKLDLFLPKNVNPKARKQVGSSQCQHLQDLFPAGLGTHHAGMLKHARRLTESLFSEGQINVLVCTATLAWGVNLPAHTVIIHGTQVYNSQQGGWTNISILDVMQIFGRAGRPQFDTSGDAYILTSAEQLPHYIRSLTHSVPIESKLNRYLPDHLNAEIVLGTVTSKQEAWQWFKFTYCYIRMCKNPQHYGLKADVLTRDPQLFNSVSTILNSAANSLDEAEMVRYEAEATTENFQSVYLGRIASHYYIQHETVRRWSEAGFQRGKSINDYAAALALIAQSAEFDQIQVREEEIPELVEIRSNFCVLESGLADMRHFKFKAGGRGGGGDGDDGGDEVSSTQVKVRSLIQAWIAHFSPSCFSLSNDMQYVAEQASRICRALFEIALQREQPSSVKIFLTLAKMIERRAWAMYPEIIQFGDLPPMINERLKEQQATVSKLADMDVRSIGSLIRNFKYAKEVFDLVRIFPRVVIEHEVAPITATILRVKVVLTMYFHWNQRHHGMLQPWHILIEDSFGEKIHHKELVLLNNKQVNDPRDFYEWGLKQNRRRRRDQELKKVELNFTLPIRDGHTHFLIRAISDRWVRAEETVDMILDGVVMPEDRRPFTELLSLQPLELATILSYPKYRQIMKFKYLNSVQTQCFHTLYHTDGNVLFGAPTGSGKTVAAEMAMFRVFNIASEVGKDKVVYIAPLKALVKERMKDWSKRFGEVLGKTVLELSGDHTPDVGRLNHADILCCTPEKWDGISRNWQNRAYVQSVALVILDEIHMLGGDRGPILEVIVSRMRYMGWHLGRKIRIIGLSTALANATDLASWMGIDGVGLYNFRPQVRPVPLELHIQGYPGRHYCPRMATMNKPCFAAIEKHARYVTKSGVETIKPVIIFVSSRRQTRITALEIIQYLTASENPALFAAEIEQDELDHYASMCNDETLQHTLTYGVGLHHAGLTENDKDIMEHMFVTTKLKVLIATSTLAWGVNFPAHLVIIKGTEYYDAKTKSYVDFSLTDVLQMMGRAGRPQFHTESGVAVVMVHEPKKAFYKKFVHDPFPVESSLHKYLHEHINAEIVAGTISKRQDTVDYLTWTYLFRRLYRNPSYYGLDSSDHQAVSRLLSSLVEKTLRDLAAAKCVEEMDPDDPDYDPDVLVPTVLGRIASFYYMTHTSVAMFDDAIGEKSSIQDLLQVLSEASEFSELPVRHNEDKQNAQLARLVPIQVDTRLLDSPHVKTHLLLQAHFSQAMLPVQDYITDTKSVLDNSIRVVQAMVDIAANNGLLFACLKCMSLLQMIIQGRWVQDNTLLQLPHIESDHLSEFGKRRIGCIGDFLENDPLVVRHHLKEMGFSSKQENDICRAAAMFPLLDVVLFYDIEYDEDDADADPQIKVTVELHRSSPHTKHVFAPRYPKNKDEQWWVVIGDPVSGELLALKRISRINKFVSTSLVFEWDEVWDETLKEVDDQKGGRAPGYSFDVYVVCDSYIGLDLQYSFDVVKPCMPTREESSGEEEEEDEEDGGDE